VHLLLNYLLAVLALGLLIALHELGHLLAARMLGIRVARYSVGFGPTVFEFKRGETTYALAALPLGGFTRVVGMDPSDPEANHPDSYASRPVWQRLWVVVAGPLMNELLAVLLVYGVAVAGMPDTSSTTLGRVEPQSVAEQAGLKVGDRIVSVDGETLERFSDLVLAIHAHADETIRIAIERAGQPLELTAKLANPPLLGVAPSMRRFGPLAAIPAAVTWTIRTTIETVGGLVTAVLNPSMLQGPLATVQITAHEAERGIQSLVFTLALISLGLAVFNALPLPALDGGRAIFLAYEGITRRKVSPRFEGIVHGVGLLLLLGAILAMSVFEIRGLARH
jgi:regulator of sigma E protease